MGAFGSEADQALRLLLVAANDQHERTLRAILGCTFHSTHRVSSCSEALRVIGDVNPSIVLVEAELPAGDWRQLLEGLLSLPSPPPLIVFSCLADDRLWAEVLNLGGYDVLATPFEAEEVLRVVSSAGLARGRLTEGESTAAGGLAP